MQFYNVYVYAFILGRYNLWGAQWMEQKIEYALRRAVFVSFIEFLHEPEHAVVYKHAESYKNYLNYLSSTKKWAV